MKLPKLYKPFSLLIIIVGLFIINYAATIWHTRVDFTNEKRFTLSDPTKKLLRSIKEPLQINIFLKGNFPSGFKKLSSSTEDILQEFKEIAGTNLQYNFISPDDNYPGAEGTYGDSLSAFGFYPINLTSQVKEGQQQQYVYPFGIVNYHNQTFPIQLYQGKTPFINSTELNSAEALLEYNLASGISKALQPEKPSVGYLVGNAEPVQINTYDLVENVLSPHYQLFTLDLNKEPLVPEDFEVLMLVKPAQGFSEEEKFKLDQYVMNGGKLLVFVDRLNAELDSLQKGEVIAYDRDLRLNDLFFKYGVRVNADLVMDLQCDYLPFDVNGNGQFELLPWNYFPLLTGNNNHPINKNLGFVAGRFVNSIDTIEVEGIKKTVILSSSGNSRTIATPALISGKENSIEPENALFNKKNIPTAVLLEGKFTSLYANRVSQAMKDSLQKYNSSFMPSNLKENKMIIVSDGDIVLNSLSKGEPMPMGMNPYTYGSQRAFPFANREFLQNCLDYLINENGLSEAKAKDYVVRLLDGKKVTEEKTKWQIINIAVPIFLIFIFGVIFHIVRKRKYTH